MMSVKDMLQELLSDKDKMHELVIGFINESNNIELYYLNNYLKNMHLLPDIISNIKVRESKQFFIDGDINDHNEKDLVEFDLISFTNGYLKEKYDIHSPGDIIPFLPEINKEEQKYYDNIEDFYFSFTVGLIGFTYLGNTYVLFEYYGQGEYIYRLLNLGQTTLNYPELILTTESEIKEQIKTLEEMSLALLQNKDS